MTGFSVEEIAFSHRLGPPPKKSERVTRSTTEKTKHRPIIVRFKDERRKIDIYKKKSKLKGSKMMLTENLTKLRYLRYLDAIQVYGKFNTWSMNGRIFIKEGDEISELEL